MGSDQKIDVDRAYVDAAQRPIETIATKLEELAARLRRHAPSMANPRVRNGATGTAADVVQEYTNGTGNLGTFLWNLIHEAQMLDRKRMELNREQ